MKRLITVKRYVQFLGLRNHMIRISVVSFAGENYVLPSGKSGFCNIPI